MSEGQTAICVRHRQGWCAALRLRPPVADEHPNSEATLCGQYVVLPWEYAIRAPDCPDCIAAQAVRPAAWSWFCRCCGASAVRSFSSYDAARTAANAHCDTKRHREILKALPPRDIDSQPLLDVYETAVPA